jgi:membrane-associated phospholipid phosphatase
MDSPQKRPPDVGWFHQAGARLLTYWPAKMIGTTLGMTLFFAAYFWLLRNPLHPPAIMPITVVDRLVGFWPGALPLYFSLWFYVSLAPALLIDRRELISYGLAATGLSIIGLGLFFFWPTTVQPSDVDWSLHPSFAFLKSVDASGNACPSLHVAFAVFTAFWFHRLLRQMGAGRLIRALNGLWCLGILYSTMATRQHVSLDVLAGATLGATVAVVHLRLLRGHRCAARSVPGFARPLLTNGGRRLLHKGKSSFDWDERH